MTPGLAYLPSRICFEPATLKLVGEAFDQACAELYERRGISVPREAVAAHVIALASSGERDPKRLYDTVVAAFAARGQARRRNTAT